jgi:hypothetical protein
MMVERSAAVNFGNHARAEINEIPPAIVREFLRQHKATVVDVVSRSSAVSPTDSLPTGIVRVGGRAGLSHPVLTVIDMIEDAITGQIARIVIRITRINNAVSGIEGKVSRWT